MASDQILPNSSNSSKKQQQLEAGKRRLEEFRKKKAAAKKAASSNNTANGDLKPSVSDGSLQVADDITSGSLVGKNENKTIDVVQQVESHSIFGNPISGFNDNSVSSQEELKNPKIGFNSGYEVDVHHQEEDIHNHFSNTRLKDTLKTSRDDHLKNFTSSIYVTKSSPERSLGTSFVNNSSQPANGPIYHQDSSSEVGKSLEASAVANESNSAFTLSTSSSSEALSSSHNETAGRRFRPSFLDSINVSRSPSTSVLHSEAAADPFSSKVYPKNSINSSSVASMQGINQHDNFHSTKQNEDFAALEQHIEDLTQEKFSLQRTLEASRVLAESLATENSALTDSYNQQGSVVNQLKSDIERLQEEIKALLVELEAVRTEYGNARLECNAADERAKLLASEVIGLEEKALRLRSNELKLQRQLENLEAEMSSQKRKISSMEKDRQDLQSTIEALQEEKKVLQSMLRKAPVIGNSVDIKTTKKEASTSTDDLVNEEDEEDPAPEIQSTLGDNDNLQTRNFGLDVSSSSIPPDQMRMIHNINTLISELALENEELVQALSTESSLSSKLKHLNKELSHKLEVQTQRLELLTSQSMVADNNNNHIPIPVRKSPSTMVDNTPPYADEGDEVVERVLGWIMKLFPSKRQTKHL